MVHFLEFCQVGGKSADFETLESMIQFFAKKEVKSGTWNANLDIGRNFSIPVTGFYKVQIN